MDWVVLPVLACLMGAVPFGRIIGKRVARVDVREVGSRNIGATNVARTVGLRWGLLTLVLDALKGAVPVLGAGALATGEPGLPEVCGLAAVAGHQFSPFLGFRGGKGVATALGAFLGLEPLACIGALGVFVGVVAVSDFVSLGSMCAAVSVPVLVALLGGDQAAVWVSAAVAVLIVVAHRENIRRLIRGEERRWREDRKT